MATETLRRKRIIGKAFMTNTKMLKHPNIIKNGEGGVSLS
jgi:hypothetical protein